MYLYIYIYISFIYLLKMKLFRSSLFNTVATMGVAGNALCKLPLGVLLDKGGPRVTGMVGGVMVMAGSLLLGMHPPRREVFSPL